VIDTIDIDPDKDLFISRLDKIDDGGCQGQNDKQFYIVDLETSDNKDDQKYSADQVVQPLLLSYDELAIFCQWLFWHHAKLADRCNMAGKKL
jgi:hypothetical protein